MYRRLYLAAIAIGAIFEWTVVKAHHNETCEDEEEIFRSCIKRFVDSKRQVRPQNATAPQEEAERCFISNGCQKPLFQGQQFEADVERVKVCKQQLRQKSQTAITECVEKKAPDHVVAFEDDSNEKEDEKRLCYQRWALAKQTQDITICPVAMNGEKVRACIKDAWKRPADESEKWMKDFCDAKRDCQKDIKPSCQEHMAITRTLKCECSRERGSILKQEFHDCVGVSPSSKDEGQDRFWESRHCTIKCTE